MNRVIFDELDLVQQMIDSAIICDNPHIYVPMQFYMNFNSEPSPDFINFEPCSKLSPFPPSPLIKNVYKPKNRHVKKIKHKINKRIKNY